MFKEATYIKAYAFLKMISEGKLSSPSPSPQSPVPTGPKS